MTTWVLLRGLARESAHWGGLVSQLRERVPRGDRVAALDLPGNGKLHRARSPTRIAEMVQAAQAQLAGHPPPYLLVAISLGGMVAAQWAAQSPRGVAGCVLINSSFAGVSPFWQRLKPSSYDTLISLLAPGLGVAERERRVLALTSNSDLDARVLQQWVDCARERPVTRMNILRQLWAAARFRVPVTKPEVPLLLLASDHDRLVSSACSHALARTWEVPLHVHSHAGHDLPLDDPGWLVQHLMVFRDAVTQSPRN